ncbi:MAG: Bro-N domain-containing protein, partial [Hydrogenophaga sp.]
MRNAQHGVAKFRWLHSGRNTIVKSTQAAEPENHIAVFQETSIRRVWHNEAWWFSVVDVCAILTASPDAGAYWRKLKQRLNAEGGQPVTFCHGLKLMAPDGKQRETDCANTEGLFRIIQSIP